MMLGMLGHLGAGALIIAAKVEAVYEAAELARRAGREYLVIEPGSPIGIDLLSGSPDVDASYFRDTFGRVAEDAKRWVEGAVTRMKNALRMLQAAGEQYYTFDHLTSYCFDDKFAATVRMLACDRLRLLPRDSEAAWTIGEALSYEETRYNQFTPETRRAVQFSVSQLLEPLRDYYLQKTFASKQNLVQMDSVFSGRVIILHVPRTRYERAAQSIYTLAKRRFFTALENRRSDPALDQVRPVVFGIDEYQLCISESDVTSLGIIRSAGCMVLATTQGVSSLYSTLPKYHVDAALQNFTPKNLVQDRRQRYARRARSRHKIHEKRYRHERAVQHGPRSGVLPRYGRRHVDRRDSQHEAAVSRAEFGAGLPRTGYRSEFSAAQRLTGPRSLGAP